MTCGHCKSAVERTILALDPGARVTVDLPGGTADVTSGADMQAILDALQAEGYPARVAA
jgi:copper chaperone